MKMKKIGWSCLGIAGWLFLNSCSIKEQTLAEIPVCESEITIDGIGGEWKQEKFVSGLIAPWNGNEKDQTEVYLCYDKQKLYFLFKVKDYQLVYGTEEGEMSVNYSDRVELFICENQKMETYYCAEIDPMAKVMDYKAHFYRDFDYNWDFDCLLTTATIQDDGYTVEGALSLDWLQTTGILSPNGTFYLGLYRGDASDPAKMESIVWRTWIIPEAPKPDFHIPSSLAKVQLQDFIR